MILFLDTETTGLADFNKRSSDPSQPHMVQFAAILTSDSGLLVDRQHSLIKPDGWSIPLDAVAVHGITDAGAVGGMAESTAAAMLLHMVKRCDLLVAHNITFDKFILRIALRRYGLFSDEDDAWWKGLNTFCTMRSMEYVCKIPSRNGHKYKWPTLAEAYSHAFGRDHGIAHSAIDDCGACKDLYFWLKKKEAA